MIEVLRDFLTVVVTGVRLEPVLYVLGAMIVVLSIGLVYKMAKGG